MHHDSSQAPPAGILIRTLTLPIAALALSVPTMAQLTVESSFDPSQTGGICGGTHDGTIWLYECFGSTLDAYAPSGAFVTSIPRPGPGANDVDLDVTPAPMSLHGTTVPGGSLLYFDGESGPTEVYALNPADGTVLATLPALFGNSHVVGGTYHAGRGSLFLLQDRAPGVPAGNRLAEIDPNSGAILGSLLTTASGFAISFGDVDSSALTGNLYVVSSIESRIGEFTPNGTLVHSFPLPPSVSGLSTISIDDSARGAWVASSSGTVWFLSGLFDVGSSYCSPAAPNSTGSPAEVRAIGTAVRASNALTLRASGLPTNAFGFFLTSRTQGFVMNPGGSSGHLCLAGNIGRYVGPGQVQNSGASGSFELPIDLGQLPSPTGFVSVAAGETWSFQAWFRDANPSVTSNFTDGASVLFQ